MTPHRIAVALLLLAACKDAPPPRPITEITVSGAEYDGAQLLTLVPDRTICDAEAAACDLGSNSNAVPDVNGGLLVWEPGKPIRRYDVNGRYWADIGRKGKGPGEYEFAVAARLIPDGIHVVDVSNLRVARFDTAGTFLDFTSIRNVPQTTRELSLAEGHLMAITIQPQGDGSGSVFRALRVKGGTFSDTLAMLTMSGESASSDGPMFQMPGLFQPFPVWGLIGGNRFYVTAGAVYEVWEYQDGQAVRHLAVDHKPRAVEASELERSSSRRLARAGPMKAAVEDAIRRAAKVHPSITQLFASSDGGMLIREAQTLSGDSVRWSRFSPDWKIAGHFMLAESTRVLLFEPGRVLLSEELPAGIRLRWFTLN